MSKRRNFHRDKRIFDHLKAHSIYGLNSSTASNNTIEKKFDDGHKEIWYNITIMNGRITQKGIRKPTKKLITQDGNEIIWKNVNIDRNGQIKATNSCDVKYVTKTEKLSLIGVKIRDGGRIVKSDTPIIVIKDDFIKGTQSVRPVEIMKIYDQTLPCMFSSSYEIIPIQLNDRFMQYIVLQPSSGYNMLVSDQLLYISKLT